MRLEVKAFQFYLTPSLRFNMKPACVHMITEIKKVDINRTDLTVSACVCVPVCLLHTHAYRGGERPSVCTCNMCVCVCVKATPQTDGAAGTEPACQ